MRDPLSAAASQATAGVRPRQKAKRKRKLESLALGALLPVLLLAVWQLLGDAGLISRLLFPTPLTIAESLVRLTENGDLFEHLRISVVRAALGFVLGGGAGLAFGLLVGFSRSSERVLDPSVQMIRMVPHLAIAPLFILWFGFGEPSKVLLIAKGAFFPLYINTYLGIRGTDKKLFEVARVLGFSKPKQVVRLVLPSAAANILLGVRLSLGLSWLGLVVAELMGASSGIGYLMSEARQFSKTPVVFVCIILFAVIGKAADSLVLLLEKRLLVWRDSYSGK
ncbi:ABC transporter permease [Paenibacillus ginsengarvi]|uniref:ABC transporter permease n=1 Tax=Paenibacillus ginsengarvi TaxID=400777 RepID=A0A3B0BUJ2_9BACL|nr:ABC transporter permease [Paenibacillus ginsengarvi]RKN76048.1 ABC transporter permease [Paenibacillus ginsengarvi]